MRKFVIPLLLSSVMVPSVASARDGGIVDGLRSRAERSQAEEKSESRQQQREERRNSASSDNGPERPARVERVDHIERQPRVDRQVDRQQRLDRQVERMDQTQRVQRVRQVEQTAPTQQVQRTERSGNAVVDGLRDQASREQYDRNDRDGRAWSRRDNDRRWSGRDDDHRWSRNWRHDRRYDWSHYRSRYGSLYRLGRYYDPYGWGYRRWSIGFDLAPSYYNRNFWLNDPWMYRLPPAYGPYRWVRYYDDALLVNVYTGTVIDVVHNFFW